VEPSPGPAGDGGEAYCWGENSTGKVDGRFEPNKPQNFVWEARPVQGVPDGVRFRDIRAAGSFTIALAMDGTVFCWGDTTAGQCGLEGSAPVGPTRVPGLDKVRFIEAVASYSCAVRNAAPSLVCWGDNRRDGEIIGALGPNAAGLEYSAKPVPVDFIDGGTSRQVLKIGMGYYSTYAVVAGGTTYGFGWNLDGLLGTDSTERIVSTPMPVVVRGAQDRTVPLMGIPTFVRIGALNQCVEVSTSSLGYRYLCWGTDNSGELGLGSIGQTQRYPVPVSVIPFEARNMVHGEAHACVTLTDDERTEILCYGDGTRVGNGSTGSRAPQTEPAPVVWEDSEERR
jgi:alpha-tubulin suppressor-like RCC1 family protein